MPQTPTRNQIARDRYKAIVALRKANVSYSAIANQLGVSATVVRYHIEKARDAGDLPPALPTQQPNLPRRARLLELWEADVPIAEIAAELGIEPVSVNTALRRLRASGVHVTSRHDTRRERVARHDAAIAPLWNAGLSAPEIAAHLAVSADFVARRVATLREQGVELDEHVGHPRTDVRRNEAIVEMWNASFTVEQITERFALSASGIYNVLSRARAAGVFTRERKVHGYDRDRRVVEMWNADTPVDEITRQLKLSAHSVYRIVRAQRGAGAEVKSRKIHHPKPRPQRQRAA